MVNKLCSTDPIFFPIPTSTTWIGKVNFKLFPIQCYRRCRCFPGCFKKTLNRNYFNASCGVWKDSFRFCQYLMFPVCCYDGQGSVLFQRVQWNSPTTPSLFLRALNTTRLFKSRKHSRLIISLRPPWPTWSFNIVERSNFFLSVFLPEVNETKKLPLSWKDMVGCTK